MPITAANVVLLETKLGTQTDESGRFEISGIPPGAYTLEFNSIGIRKGIVRIDLKPGEAKSMRYQFPPPLTLQDVHLRADLGESMRRSTSVRIARLNAHDLSPSRDLDSSATIGDYRAVEEAARIPRGWKQRLVHVLEDPTLYLAPANGIKHMCIFQPGIGVRFRGGLAVVDVVICYKCGEFFVHDSRGSGQGGFFEHHAAEFLELGRQAFPSDTALWALNASRYVPSDGNTKKKR